MPKFPSPHAPYEWNGKNNMPGSKISLGHFRRRSNTPVPESSTRPEDTSKVSDNDGRKSLKK